MSCLIDHVCARTSDLKLCPTADSAPQRCQLKSQLLASDGLTNRLWRTAACVAQTFHALARQLINDHVNQARLRMLPQMPYHRKTQ